MIKTHNITNLKYLCITKKDDYEKYTGSGSYWLNHLKTHGYDFSTELLFETEDYEEFLKICLYVSAKYNVALSEEFANAIPEAGYETGVGKTNLELFWEYASNEIKNSIYEKRAKSLKNNGNHWAVTDKREETIPKIREKVILHFSKMTLEERREIVKPMLDALIEFHENKEDVKYLHWKEKLSAITKQRWANMSEAARKEYGKKVSQGRLSMSQEAKDRRKEKIKEKYEENYKAGKFDELFSRYSKERMGVKNPGAKIIEWYGELYTKGNFEKLFGKVDSEKNRKIFLNEIDCNILYEEKQIKYDILECPHCGKKSNTNNLPSSFKRWHFDNCKKRKQ